MNTRLMDQYARYRTLIEDFTDEERNIIGHYESVLAIESYFHDFPEGTIIQSTVDELAEAMIEASAVASGLRKKK